VQALETELARGGVSGPEELAARFACLQAAGAEQEWAWCAQVLEQRLGCAPAQADPAELAAVLQEWRQAAGQAGRLTLADAGKEFDERARTAFGADGGPAEREADFLAVRGRQADHPTVRRLQEEIGENEARAERLIAWLRGLAP